MQITQRRVCLGMILVMVVGAILDTIIQITTHANLTQILTTIVAALILSALFWAYWRGWETARYIFVVIMMLIVPVALPEPFVTQQLNFAIFIPPIVALVFAEPRWILASAIFPMLVLLARAGWEGVYTRPLPLVLYGMINAGIFLARMVTDTAIRISERARADLRTAAEALERTNADLERRVDERTADLQTALDESQARAEAQARLLEENERQRSIIRELSMPVIPVSATTLVMPLVGNLDHLRLQQLREQALRAIERTSARYLMLDITGVLVVDSQIAEGILTVVLAARLLGTEVILVGIRPEVAQTIVGLDVDLQEMRTFSDLQSALRHQNGVTFR